MIEVIDSPDDVIAMRASGKIDGADLEKIMDRLDQLLKSRDKVHVFVETRSIDGIEISGLPSYTARARPLFGKLDRFGRVVTIARLRGSQHRLRVIDDPAVEVFR